MLLLFFCDGGDDDDELMQSLEPNGCYLLDNGQKLFIWLGKDLDPKFLQLIYGSGIGDEEISSIMGGDVNNEAAQKIKTIITYLQTCHSTFKQIATIKQVRKFIIKSSITIVNTLMLYRK
jgi:hypothetical protein